MTPTSNEVQFGTSFSPNPVIAKGDGPALVFLHGPFGQEWSGYLDDLSENRRVFAPANPGAEVLEDLGTLHSIHDLVIYYDELFDNLGLDTIDLVGHSYGGMIAAEYAAMYPKRVRKLVLIDPMGLWIDDSPVEDFFTVAPEKLAANLYHDPTVPEIVERLQLPDDLAEAQGVVVQRFLALASTAHFTSPIPERGLIHRIRRISAPTLIVHGKQDGLVPAVYAGEFERLLSDGRTALIDNSGHFPYLEQRTEVSRVTVDFLG